MSTTAGAGGGTTRAVVVDDSRFMRTLIRGLLEDGGIEVVGEADDGSNALDTVRENDPDVVTMDIEMPTTNGIEAVEEIMAERPTPVLMLSAHAEENADVTFEALDRGAVDFVTKPGGEVTSSMPRVKRELVEKVESAARVDLSAATRLSPSAGSNRGASTGGASASGSTRRSGSSGARSPSASASATGSASKAAAEPEPEPAPASASRSEGAADTAVYPEFGTLVVGASTGGPNVVERVLGGLPRAANLRVLVVQHMPEGFTGRFATRLDERSDYDVREAESGERIEAGEARVAPGDHHLVTTSDRNGRLRLELTETEPVHGVRPAIDITMASAVESVDGPLCAVLLTGMGRDGVDGVRRVSQAGGRTIAQDEETSAIFGMPRRAIESGCIDVVAPAEGIAEHTLEYLTEE